MKIVGIGDLLISEQHIKEGFKEFEEKGHQVETIQWQVSNYEELQNINLKVEVNGSEVYETPMQIINAIKDADIVITHFCPITKKVLESLLWDF